MSVVRSLGPLVALALLVVSCADTPITDNAVHHDTVVNWAPDGRSVAVQRIFDEGDADIFLVDVATGEETRLTDRVGEDMVPNWSPHGRRLAFTSDERHELAVINGWSPDGSTLLFCAPVSEPYVAGGDDQFDDFAMYSVEPSPGAVPRLLVDLPGEDSYGSFSPDGKWLLYSHQGPVEDRDNEYDQYVAEVDGSERRQLTHRDPS